MFYRLQNCSVGANLSRGHSSNQGLGPLQRTPGKTPAEGTHLPRWSYETAAVPLAHAQLARRHSAGSLRIATVKRAPYCVTCLPFNLKVMVAGTTTFAASRVTLVPFLCGITTPGRSGRLWCMADHRQTGPTITPEEEAQRYRVNAVGAGMNLVLPTQKVTLSLKYFDEFSNRWTYQGYSLQISAGVVF